MWRIKKWFCFSILLILDLCPWKSMLTYWCWSCLSSCFPCRSSECDGVTLCDTSWQLLTDGEWSGGSKTRSASHLTPQWLPDYGAHHSPLRTAFRKYFHFKFPLSHAQGALLICSTFKYLEYLPALADRLVIWAVLTFAIICPFYHPDIWHWIWNQNYLVLCLSGCCRLWVWEPRRWSQWLEIWIDQLECLPFTGHRWSRAGHLDSRHLFLTIFVLESWEAGAGWATLTPPSSRGPNLSFLSASIALGMLEKPLCLSMPRIFIA